MTKTNSKYFTRFKSAVTGLFASAVDALSNPREYFSIKILRRKAKVVAVDVAEAIVPVKKTIKKAAKKRTKKVAP